MINTTETLQKFEAVGREAVAARLEKGYFNEAKAALAKDWLADVVTEPPATAETEVKPKKAAKNKASE